MPTYQMTAPDGKTYRIDGPEGATDDQVRAEIIKQNSHLSETTTPPAQPYQRQPSFGEQVRGVAYPVMEAVGAGLGGVVGSGVGPAGTIGGTSLGYAGVKGLENIIDQYTGAARPETLRQSAARTASDIATGATYEMGGQVLGQIPALAAKTGVGVWNYLSPKAKVYLAATEGKGQEILNALRGQTTLVPGSIPTAAQAASGAGATKFAALGQEAANVLPSQYLARAQAQEKAQLASIQNIGQTKQALAAAENLRRSTAQDLYAAAGKKTAETDEELTDLLSRPSMDKVISRAANIAAEKQIPFQIGKNVPAKTVPSALVDEFGRPLGEVTTPAEVAKYPGTSVHSMKMAFDDLISNPEQFGIGAAEVKAIGDTRQKFMSWAEKNIPEYKVARETYAAQSKPINQMEVGQFLEKKLEPALGEGAAKLRASGFATAIEEAPRTIKKATGQDRFTELAQVLKPEQLAAVNAVRDDLARAALTERQAAAASGQGKATLKEGTTEFVTMRLPNLLSRVTAIANDIMQRVEGKIDRKLAMELATEMLNPETAAKGIENALRRQELGVISPQNQLMFKATGRGIPFATNALINQGQQ